MYARGKNRLFYKSKIPTKQDIEVFITNPKLEKIGPLSAIFIEDGLYYIDIWFKRQGSYFFNVFEGEDKKHSDVLVVGGGSAFIPYPNEERLI